MFPNNVLSSVFQPGTKSSQQIKQQLLSVLQDERVQSLSSLDLNQWASLTFHEGQHSAEDDLCECLFATLAQVLKQQPSPQYSPLALLKALAVAKHMLLLGADRVVQEARVLGPPAAALQENYNTALLAQQTGGATGFLMRLKGGSVDQGGPVREAAEEIVQLLMNPALLQQQRARAADPNSLVPVGSSSQLAFCTDEMRYRALQQKIQQQTEIKSNLKKATDGFGSGYNASDGKSVVGAAHSIEEMMRHAQRQEQKFSEEATTSTNQEAFSEYTAPTAADFLTSASTPTTDLLFASPPTNHTDNTVDLLSLSSEPAVVSAHAQPQQADLLGFDETTTTTAASSLPTNDLLSLGAQNGGASAIDPLSTSSNTELFGLKTSPEPTPPLNPSLASSDPFAGLATPALSMAGQSSVASMHSVRGTGPIGVVPNEDGGGGGAFVMGGAAGSGLQPVGSAPSAPPPPPPPPPATFY